MLQKDPIKLVLILAIIVFGFVAFYMSTQKGKNNPAAESVSASDPTQKSASHVEVVDIKPTPKPVPPNDEYSNNEVILEDEASAAAADSESLSLFNQTQITAAERESYFQDMQKVLMSARAVPHREGDLIKGFQLSDIVTDSLWTRFGFKEGDVVLQFNGEDLNSAASSMMLFSQLKTASTYKFKILRQKKFGVLIVTFK